MNTAPSFDAAALAHAFIAATPADQSAFLDQLTAEVGHQSVFEQPALWFEGSSMYLVEDRWQLDAVITSGDYVICRTASEFEAFLADSEAESALLASSAALPLETAGRLLEHCATSKTVLYDAVPTV